MLRKNRNSGKMLWKDIHGSVIINPLNKLNTQQNSYSTFSQINTMKLLEVCVHQNILWNGKNS